MRGAACALFVWIQIDKPIRGAGILLHANLLTLSLGFSLDTQCCGIRSSADPQGTCTLYAFFSFYPAISHHRLLGEHLRPSAASLLSLYHSGWAMTFSLAEGRWDKRKHLCVVTPDVTGLLTACDVPPSCGKASSVKPKALVQTLLSAVSTHFSLCIG